MVRQICSPKFHIFSAEQNDLNHLSQWYTNYNSTLRLYSNLETARSKEIKTEKLSELLLKQNKQK
jgi:hypothetical protein